MGDRSLDATVEASFRNSARDLARARYSVLHCVRVGAGLAACPRLSDRADAAQLLLSLGVGDSGAAGSAAGSARHVGRAVAADHEHDRAWAWADLCRPGERLLPQLFARSFVAVGALYAGAVLCNRDRAVHPPSAGAQD